MDLCLPPPTCRILVAVGGAAAADDACHFLTVPPSLLCNAPPLPSENEPARRVKRRPRDRDRTAWLPFPRATPLRRRATPPSIIHAHALSRPANISKFENR